MQRIATAIALEHIYIDSKQGARLHFLLGKTKNVAPEKPRGARWRPGLYGRFFFSVMRHGVRKRGALHQLGIELAQIGMSFLPVDVGKAEV